MTAGLGSKSGAGPVWPHLRQMRVLSRRLRTSWLVHFGQLSSSLSSAFAMFYHPFWGSIYPRRGVEKPFLPYILVESS